MNGPNNLTVTFLGVRGSAPCCDPQYTQYGGHTSCVMVQAGEQTIFLDAGSGIISANALIKSTRPSSIHILLSHTHLDHIMGLPFFNALWKADQEIHMYAANLQEYGGLHQTIRRVFSPPIFPIDLDDLKSNITTHDIDRQVPFTIGDVHINMCALNHPNGGTGYRITYQGKSVCYITDTEHFSDGPDESILQLIQDADLFIYDASYDDDTYPQFKGWGHSTWQEGCRLGEQARVKRIALFHHEPLHTDDVLNKLAERIQKQTPQAFLAKQGMTLTL